ncbi:MAG: ABC transporter ATP-binding protein [Anaerolineaceae bacterium]|nr:ABC transporter ATP-binding protein [Anaerolineaceae bacterium]
MNQSYAPNGSKANPPLGPSPQAQAGASNGRAYICLQGVSKSYLEGEQRRTVLDQVSVEFYQGEFVAVIGKSGSGKTTLLNLISGIDHLDAGSIILDGQRVAEENEYQRTIFRRQKIGFIFQFFNLIPTLTVWENVILPLELNQLLNEASIDWAHRLLGEVGLGERLKTFPDRLSGGEQQRVAIARALVHNPVLVLADEPTGNLDEDTGRAILDMLDRLTRRAGKNMILVTHSSEAASYADRVLYLHEGRLVEQPK